MEVSKKLVRDTKQIVMECRDNQDDLSAEFDKMMRENIHIKQGSDLVRTNQEHWRIIAEK